MSTRPEHRFYRGERSRPTPGNGLGLNLVAAVADLHGASLLLGDRLARPACHDARSGNRCGPVMAVVHAAAQSRRRLWTGIVLLALGMPSTAGAAALVVELTGVENDRGLVRVAVCTPETFTTKHCPFFSAAPAHAGTMTVSLDGVPPGRYAIQAYHDEDGNGRVRRGLFGIPTEAIGFSHDALVRLGALRFEDMAIDITEPSTTTRLRLRHVGL